MDVAEHLAKQALNTQFGLLSLEHLADENLSLSQVFSEIDCAISALSIDCVDEHSEETIGRLLWEESDSHPFVVGSQGVEYALVRYWRAQGMLTAEQHSSSIGRAERMAVVSGSVSDVTRAQIAWARDNGFTCIQFHVTAACDPGGQALEDEIERCYQLALIALESGTDPLLYTAEGLDDPAVAAFKRQLESSGLNTQAVNQQVGEALGKLLVKLIDATGLRRVVISGGDTSGHATRCLGIFALTALAPTIPGAPIFKAHANNNRDGLEVALKGGQMGTTDYFGWVKNGGGKR